MATLEKIRSKSVLLVSVIGFALVLFIITLVDNPFALFQDQTSVAKVKGHKIEIENFNRRVEQAQQMLQQRNQHEDNAQLQLEVLNAMAQEALLAEEIEALGITVSDNELQEAMYGNNPHPYMLQLSQQMQASPADLYAMAYNPTQFGLTLDQTLPLQQQLVQMESTIAENIKQQKLLNLLQGTIVANKLDARALYDENMGAYSVIFARKDVSSVADDDIKVEAADIKALYNERASMFELPEEARVINYINIDVVPSSADRIAAQQNVEDALVDLREQPAMEGIGSRIGFIVNRAEAPAEKINPAALRTFITEAQVGEASQTQATGNELQIAKLLGKSNKVDEVTFDFLTVIHAGTTDSIIAVLNAADDINTIEGVDNVQTAQTLTISESGVDEAMANNLRTAPLNSFFVVQSAPGQSALARVTERKAPVTMYEYGVANYPVEASTETTNALQGQLKAFLDSVATAADFNSDKALARGLNLRTTMVSASAPSVDGIEESRDIVRWAIDAKKGDVSKIFSNDRNSRFTAAALTDIYKGSIPASDTRIKEQLTAQATTDKKAEKLLADYAGKADNVAGYAAAMGVSVDTTTVTFGQAFIPRLGMGQSQFAGAVAAAKKGELIGPMQSGASVIVGEIIADPEETMPYDQNQYSVMFDRTRGKQMIANPQMIGQILLGRNHIENRLLKFYNR